MRILSIAKLSLLSILLFVCNTTFAQTSAPATTPPPSAPATTPPPAAPATTPPPAPTAMATPPPATPKPVAKAAPPVASAPATAPAAPAAPRSKAPAKPVEAPVADPTPAGYTGPVWKKQITRDIELGEKVDTNIHRLRDANPDNTLMEMFAIGIKTGKISSFYTSEFSLATRIKVTDFGKLFMGQADTIPVRNAAGKYVPKIVHRNFNYAGVHKYRILEEWTSYPGIGKTDIQIVGIAPLKDITGDSTTHGGVEPIFWVHYTEDIKTIIARYDQYHPNNTLGGRLWSEYFIAPTTH